MKQILFIGIVLMFIASCTPVQQECPKIQCPVCKSASPTQQQAASNEQVFVYFIDVGQGDSILIKSGEAEMLIDCGKNSMGPLVVDFLKERQVANLEYLMITHPDSDHLGGCDDVLRSIKTHAVITNGESSDTNSYKEVMAEIDTEQNIISNNDNAWNIGPAVIRVIQSNNGLSDDNQNSIVSKLTYNNIDVLFTGDCDNKCEDLLLDKDIQSEILKVAHHGTKFGTDIDFLEKVTPQAAIISVGNNSYGHPTQEALDRLSQEGVLIYRTDMKGNIILKLDGVSYEIII